MENIIYNELLCRGYSVDVGVVEVIEKNNGTVIRDFPDEIPKTDELRVQSYPAFLLWQFRENSVEQEFRRTG